MSAVGPRRPDRPRPRPAWLADAERLDLAVHAAIAATPSPALDRAMGRLTRAADHTGVHYPGDVIAGALVGVSLADLTGRALRRRMPS
jgi:hypothetical protein